MTQVKKDASGKTICRRNAYGQKVACRRCVVNHRSSNCLPSHDEDVRVIDGVGRKKGSKNRPKGSQQVKHKVMKPARPQRGNQAQLTPQQNAQLEEGRAQEQPAVGFQAIDQLFPADMFLQQGALGAQPQVHHAHAEPVGNNMYIQHPMYNVQPAPWMNAQPPVHGANNVVQPMINYQMLMTPQNNWSNWQLAGSGQQQEVQGMNFPKELWDNPHDGGVM